MSTTIADSFVSPAVNFFDSPPNPLLKYFFLAGPCTYDQAMDAIENNPQIVDTINIDNRNALFFQTEPEVVKMLLETYKLNANHCDNFRKNPLYNTNLPFQSMQLLIDAGADVNCVDQFGMTPLMVHIRSGKKVSLLLKNGANAHVMFNASRNIVSLLQMTTKTSVIKKLLSAGVKDPEALVYHVTISKNVKIVKLLLEAGIWKKGILLNKKFRVTEMEELTQNWKNSNNDRYEILRLLMTFAPRDDINSTLDNGENILFVYKKLMSPALLDIFIANDGDINARNDGDFTAISVNYNKAVNDLYSLYGMST